MGVFPFFIQENTMKIDIIHVGDNDSASNDRATRFVQALQQRLTRDFGPGIVDLFATSDQSLNDQVSTGNKES